MKKPSKFAIQRAKRTMFGRLLCRLFGDQNGQAMMEYVVIGVLIVAAAVAMVALFGKEIRHKFLVMIHAEDNDQEEVQKVDEERRGDRPGEVEDAKKYGDDVSNSKSE